VLIALALDVAPLLQTVHQFDHAVVLHLQALGDFSNRGHVVFGHAFNRQHELILFWLQADLPGGPPPQLQKAFQLVPELG
jgi:hypothetical protein